MKKLAKIFLTVSVATFAISLTGPGSELLWGLLKSLGAVCFIGFFITQLLAKESARFDEEEASRLAEARRNSSTPQPSNRASRDSGKNAGLTAASAR